MNIASRTQKQIHSRSFTKHSFTINFFESLVGKLALDILDGVNKIKVRTPGRSSHQINNC